MSAASVVAASSASIGDSFMNAAMNSKAGMKPMEFTVLYLIQRMLPIYWQKFFEQNLKLKSNDCY